MQDIEKKNSQESSNTTRESTQPTGSPNLPKQSQEAKDPSNTLSKQLGTHLIGVMEDMRTLANKKEDYNPAKVACMAAKELVNLIKVNVEIGKLEGRWKR